MSFSRHPFLLAYTKYFAAYTKFDAVNQQVKPQCMQCMQKLKIKFLELCEDSIPAGDLLLLISLTGSLGFIYILQ